jgi:phosphopantothenoylcysteine synthetase/decarboxylase
MDLLVSAGNTQVPIDRVRCITNIFTGRTGTGIGLHAHSRGHRVTLLTSHPEVVHELSGPTADLGQGWKVHSYRTFEDLEALLAEQVRQGPDVIIHCAAVNDYRAVGIYAPSAGTYFRPERNRWENSDGGPPTLEDRGAGKVKSDEPELWLRMVRTPKLIDHFRSSWGYRGILVKFKLEVGVDEAHLLDIAERSRQHSAADLMVANTLEGVHFWAILGPVDGKYRRIAREELAACLLDVVERLREERTHG